MNELENVMTFGEKMQQFDNAILLVKEYKKVMRDLLEWIRCNYSRDFFFHEFLRCDKISKALSRLNLSLKFKFGSPNITIVSNSDSTLKTSIKLLEGDAYAKLWSKGGTK